MHKSGTNRSRGFTLIELSIVLVLISLIVTGIMAARVLIYESRLRGTISQINQIQTAVNSFQLQYDAWPGDMPDAFDYWGTEFGCNDTWVVNDWQGCNGNGNTVIDMDGTAHREQQRAWQQLAHTEMIPGSYAGFGPLAAGVTIPRNKLADNGGFFFASPGLAFDNRRNAIIIERTGGGGIIAAAKARKIDAKMDDGLPADGNIYTARDWFLRTDPICIDANNEQMNEDPDISYILNDAENTCVMIFWLNKP